MPENREQPTQRDGSLFPVGVFGIRSFSREMKPARRVDDSTALLSFFRTAGRLEFHGGLYWSRSVRAFSKHAPHKNVQELWF